MVSLVAWDEATRTPDPYVPNVVRYQLRYIPITRKRMQRYSFFFNYTQKKAEIFETYSKKTYKGLNKRLVTDL